MESQNQNVKIIVCTGGAWETVYGVLRYKPLGLPKRILPLPLNLTYSELMTCVARKLNSESNTEFRMTYQFPNSSSSNRNNKYVVVDIADDEDVDVFMDMVVKTTHGLITLYVVEEAAAAAGAPSRWEQSRAGNSKGVNKPTRVFSFQQLFPEREGANVGGRLKDPVTTQVVDSEDDFGDATDLFGHDQKVNHQSKLRPGSPEGTDGNTDKDTLWSMSPRAPTPAPDTTLKLNTPVFSKTENDMVWGMPPWLRDPGPCNNPKAPNPNTPNTPNMFNSKEALKLTLKLKCLEEGFKIKITRSTKDLYEVKCLSDGCYWRIRGTRVHGTDMFRVENLEVQHKCSRSR